MTEDKQAFFLDGSSLRIMFSRRECIYDFLRRLFLTGPNRDLLSSLIELTAGQPAADTGAGPVWEQNFICFLQALEPDRTERLSAILQPEFTRLFIGPRHVPAPPYESVYRSPARALMQETTLAVRKKYRAAGLLVRNFNREPDDHIGLELEFIYYLNQQAAAALARQQAAAVLAAIDRQQQFLAEHLSQWVPAFCGDIAANTGQDFFRKLAGFMAGFIREDLAQVDLLKRAIAGRDCG
ncbi:TorD/DmsD family molecular chaperone [Sporomusa termitida]|uniref:Tat proofreading chaperone DmsD n=1 Tax=Sporomusa termitida TaxID=2377 RepID=A0A517DWG3_9FIRM|nr:molecular chaperone TorD family protein [Sporomusa termitida]QDR81687.1 Tat proofreading chaperone DmsD [Sporomusa termitida]